MKNQFLLFVLFLFSAHWLIGQPGSISIEGVIKDETGSPLPYASVYVEGSTKGTASDARGKFTLTNLTVGTYTLVVSSVGFQAYKQTVSVTAAGLEKLTITLQASHELLNEVIVTSRKATETKDKLTNSITVVDAKKIEATQLISSNPADILAVTVPGLGVSSGTSSNWGQTLRGRQVLVMVDGVPQSTPLRNGSVDLRTIDPYALERIEVIRGATAIYGNGAAGGIINYITKRNTSGKKIGGKTEIATTGSIIDSKESIGARGYQSLFGRVGKLDYTASGSFEQTGVNKDAEGDPIGPLYGLSNNEIYNGFLKLGYDLTPNQRVQVSYNYFGSRDKTDMVEIPGNIKEGRKTTAGQGEIVSVRATSLFWSRPE
jgi:iron complex outermembrane receptor protein